MREVNIFYMTQQQPKISVFVLMGGYTSEFDISIKSGTVVCQALDPTRYNIYPCMVTKDHWFYRDTDGLEHTLDRGSLSIQINDETIRPDVIFNTIHGSPGEDGYIAALCTLLNVPQTSADYYAAALTFNKRDCLAVLKAHGILCAESIYCDKGNQPEFKFIHDRLGLPFFVKPNRAGSSYGISMVCSEDEYIPALERAFAEDHQILMERAISGTEVSVGAYSHLEEPIILTPTEIVPENSFFDLSAKYEGKAQEITPARISENTTETIQKLVRKIYAILEIRGACRADFIIENGTPYFIELNSTPGLSEHSLIPQQAKYSGLSLTEFFDRLIQEAINHHKNTTL